MKYVVPGRRLQVAGVPSSTQWFGAAVGVVGFFVVPVVGLFIGFVLGVYARRAASGSAQDAWPSTGHSLRPSG